MVVSQKSLRIVIARLIINYDLIILFFALLPQNLEKILVCLPIENSADCGYNFYQVGQSQFAVIGD